MKIKHTNYENIFTLFFSFLFLFNANAKDLTAWIDLSHTQGVPLGGLGYVYTIYGKYGFIRANLNQWPDKYAYGFETPESIWGYTPLIPHELESSSTPIQIFDVIITNILDSESYL